MLFSTKAEYGIRLMVALGRREGPARWRWRPRRGRDASRSPTSSTSSPSCARPAWSPRARRARRLLAREARRRDPDARRRRRRSRGRSLRWSASTKSREGRVLCSHETDEGRRLRDEAALDARAGRRHQGPRRDHARGAGRVRPKTTSRSAKRRPDRRLAPALRRRRHGRAGDQEPARDRRGQGDPQGPRPEVSTAARSTR